LISTFKPSLIKGGGRGILFGHNCGCSNKSRAFKSDRFKGA
jgi:hypothetical protein